MSEKPTYKELEQRNESLEEKFARRRQSEGELMELEKCYRNLFNSISDLIMIHDLEGRLLNVNPAVSKVSGYTFEDLSGFSKEEIEGKKAWTEFVYKEDLQRMRQYHDERRDNSGSAPTNYESRFIDRNGNIRNIFSTIEPIPGARKTVVSLLDISDRKKMEEALQKSYEELDRRVKERTSDLAAANEKLKREIGERLKAESEKEKLIVDLKKALKEVNKLSGLLPICASCKKIRDDKGYWNQLEDFIQKHSEAEFSHGVCPDCAKKLYPDFVISG
jgi:PAS domain S-box-containing protein